jgi:hypothetical protein
LTPSLLVLLVAVVGCVDADERADYTYVHAAILSPSCATSNCHSNLGSSLVGTAEAGLQFQDREGAYFVLTGRVCDGEVPDGVTPPDRNFVDPGDPEGSRLVRILRGLESFIMPPDAPLPEGEIQAIEAWIRAGAPCD